MSVASWPTDLPKPERQTWQSTPQDPRQAHTPAAGVPQYRGKYSLAGELVSLSIVLDRNQKSIFDNFYKIDCKNGLLPFWMPAPTTDGWALLSGDGKAILNGDGTPILMSKTWLCIWGDTPPVETISGQVRFKKSFSIVVAP